MNSIASLLLRRNKALNSIHNNVKGACNSHGSAASSDDSFRFFSTTVGSAASLRARNAALSGLPTLPEFWYLNFCGFILNLGSYAQSIRSMCTTASVPAEKAGLKLLVTAGPRAQKMVGIWLFGSAAWVFSMVILGGVTWLTRSSLSMTDWKFTGQLPPLTEEEWAQEFEKYKQSREYKR